MNKRLAALGALIALLVASIALSSSAVAEKGPKHGSGSSAGDPSFDGSSKLRRALTVDGITAQLERLQQIADENDGTRAAGFPGFDASADYVAATMKRAGWKVSRQPFDFDVFFQDAPSVFEQVSPDAETYVEDTDYSTMEFSGSGEVNAELVAVDLTLPPSADAELEQRL